VTAIYLAIAASFLLSAAVIHVVAARLGAKAHDTFMQTLMAGLFFAGCAGLVYLIGGLP